MDNFVIILIITVTSVLIMAILISLYKTKKIKKKITEFKKDTEKYHY